MLRPQLGHHPLTRCPPHRSQRWSTSADCCTVAQTGSAGGYVKQGDTNNFPISGLIEMSAALVKLVPQGMREMHW